mgnify:FL=1
MWLSVIPLNDFPRIERGFFMPRSARLVAQGLPHHIIQRGNRRQKVFLNENDKYAYLELLHEQKLKYNLKIWAYCLMDNHVHLIVVPEKEENLSMAIGEAHKNYTRMINFREGWRGYLWEGRFKSFILDEQYLFAAVRYVERNPVRAKIVKKAHEYKWSSAKIRVNKLASDLLDDFFLTEEIADWEDYLSEDENMEDLILFRRHGATGKPLGNPLFIKGIGQRFGIDLEPKKRGPKPKLSI